MNKKVLGIFLVLVCAFVLFGCTQSNNATDKNSILANTNVNSNNSNNQVNNSTDQSNSNTNSNNSANTSVDQSSSNANTDLNAQASTSSDQNAVVSSAPTVQITDLTCNKVFPTDIVTSALPSVSFTPSNTSVQDNYLICTYNSNNNYSVSVTVGADVPGNFENMINTATTFDPDLNCDIANIGSVASECYAQATDASGQDLAEIIFVSSDSNYDVVTALATPAGVMDVNKEQSIVEQMANAVDLKLTS